jgi:hypothetical protein
MNWTMKRFEPMTYWAVPQEWDGQTAFIVAGGPSVLDIDLEQLRGRNVIAINSSIYAVPWAQFLYFGDFRWWQVNGDAIADFSGRIVTVSKLVRIPKILICRKVDPPGLALEPDALVQRWTSLTAATNLAAHLVGPGGTIVWLGADGKFAADGRKHHHKDHPWESRPDAYKQHHAELATIIPSLQRLSIRAFNASPGTAWADLLPVVSLEEFLRDRQAA